MKTAIRLGVAIVLLIASAQACDFQYDPVARRHFYREEGWDLPGKDNVDVHAKVNLYGIPITILRTPGAKVYVMQLDDDHYIARFPSQIFTFNGVRQKMRPLLAKAVMVRIEVNGRIVAYSYGLIPVSSARKVNGQWVVEGEVGCIFNATYIDDRGDGVFRDLVPGTLTDDLIPTWAKPAEQS